MKKREVNSRYRPVVTVKKVKKDIPTVVMISGETYVLAHRDQRSKGKR